MRIKPLVFLLIFYFLALGINPARSGGYADCVSVTGTEISKEFGEYTYTLSVRDSCSSGIRSYSLTLLSNNFSIPNVRESSIILNNSTKKVRFSLRQFVPGSYQPSLEISSNQDYEKRIISLPGFSIQEPLDCIQLSTSGLDRSSENKNYSVTLKNICLELDSDSFINISIQLMGIYDAQFTYQKIYQLSNSGTRFNFGLNKITEGNYFPTLYLKNNSDSGSKVISLMPFSIQKSGGTSSDIANTKQVCVSGKGYSEKCYDGLGWTYEVCSPNQSGKVQIQSGKSWIFGWTFKGVKDLDRCYTATPFLISLNGTSTKSSNLRLAYVKYQSNPSFYSNFKVTVR